MNDISDVVARDLLGGNAVSRLTTRYALEGGAPVNLVENPAVSRNACR